MAPAKLLLLKAFAGWAPLAAPLLTGLASADSQCQRVQTREEIRSAAIDNGGKPLGRVRFIERTGITEYAITQHWPRYSDALREAGFQPNALNRALNDDDVLARFVELAEKLGHVPTSNELRHTRATDPTFPSRGLFDRLGSKQDRIARALAYCRATSSHTAVAALLEAAYADEADRGEGDLARAAEESAPGFVYLARGHPGEYKIGRTNLVDRRLVELGAVSAVAPVLVHEIKTDDPVGVEEYWHRRFCEQAHARRVVPTDRG